MLEAEGRGGPRVDSLLLCSPCELGIGNRESGNSQLDTWSSSRCCFWMSRGCLPELGKAVMRECRLTFPQLISNGL